MRELAVFLSACERVGPELRQSVLSLSARFEEVVVAIDDGGRHVEASLPARWSAVRHALRELPRVWVTPLAATPSLRTREDQLAALTARLGPIALLQVDRAELVSLAQTAGHVVELREPLAGAPPAALEAAPRALVVLRAQPFHRGHLALLEHALTLAPEVIVVIAAAERSFSAHDPFTAGERLALLRAGLGAHAASCWLVALAAPSWPALALPQLAFLTPSYSMVAAHNPVLRAMALAHGKQVTGLAAPLAIDGQVLSATAIRARLAQHGPGAWLEEALPAGTAALLASDPALASRCTLVC